MSFDFRSLSLFKIIALVLVALCFIMMFLPWITMSALGQSMTYGVFGTSIEGEVGSFWSVMLVIFAILSILAILLAVFGILTGRNNLVLPLACLAVLMFLFAFFQVLHVKGELKAQLGEYASYMGGLLKIHVGVGGWLFLLFGLGACGLLFYEDRTQGKNFFDFSAVKSAGVSMPKVNLGATWAPSAAGPAPAAAPRTAAARTSAPAAAPRSPSPAAAPTAAPPSSRARSSAPTAAPAPSELPAPPFGKSHNIKRKEKG